ncbi:putative PurR-regulated permease PerM [Scopulibacillus darangshiensis]|uniref:Putative PurR-regulated permease PerM n=1 Tax=Scopulibacillus darangshiensis TaxID=442528 RepID=A0A4R2P9N9_9BACL|nr:AI-2E family transporter [Scopulibacillus darangshiensis]TCP31753.1 putative PurR-regulated permease PerM [Scopulibacillus darangshiensis]
MPRSKYFRFAVWILLIFTVIMIGSKISFVFRPIGILITTLAAPVLVAGVLYYILRPVVRLLVKVKVPRIIAILLLYLIVIGLITVIVLGIGPAINKQFVALANAMPGLIKDLGQQLKDFQNSNLFDRFQLDKISYTDITNRFSHSIGNITASIGNNVLTIIQSITGIVIIIVTVPFILFYMLKDGEKLPGSILRFLPKEHQDEGKLILGDMDEALSGYIQGQMLVSLFDGVFIYIWYQIIGLDYPLILALAILFTNVIPFIGPFIGTAPGVIVGFIQSPLMALWVIVGVLIVQQIESNIISPQVMGKKLDIHPLTIIFILLVAGNLAGIIGMILAIPTYAVAKVIITRTYKLIRLRYNKGITD